jgi:starch-binding outer membrane protein, SusD/RagB family
LFAEWGHRWFDLKRRHKADAVLSLLKPTTWQPSDVLFPIPSGQIRANPALTQNPGY